MPEVKLKKFDSKVDVGVNLGSIGHGNYHILVLGSSRVVLARNVTFNEENFSLHSCDQEGRELVSLNENYCKTLSQGDSQDDMLSDKGSVRTRGKAAGTTESSRNDEADSQKNKESPKARHGYNLRPRTSVVWAHKAYDGLLLVRQNSVQTGRNGRKLLKQN